MLRKLTFVLLLLILCSQPVNAITLSFSNPTDLAERDLLMYFPNGTYIDTYNLTSTFELPADTDVYFVAKAHNINPLSDPGDWLNEVIQYMTTNVTGLVILFSCLGILGSFVFRRR